MVCSSSVVNVPVISHFLHRALAASLAVFTAAVAIVDSNTSPPFGGGSASASAAGAGAGAGASCWKINIIYNL